MRPRHGVALRAAAVWLLLMAAEVVHGTVRTLWVSPVVGDFRARQLAVVSGSALVLLIATATARWLAADGPATLAAIGLSWVGLTLLFELGIGRFVAGYSWARLAQDYDVPNGGLLPFGLAVMAAAPLIAARLRTET
jgi:hypothetical protein